MKHLHEVRAADQSARVAEEADEHRSPAELGEVDDAAVEIGEP
jgi:hypothetical protein